MGQNIRTSLAQQVAEELRVPFSSVNLVMADTQLTPYDMGTFGSRTTPFMGPQLRTVAASARNVLVEMAARRWKVSASALVVSAGRVADPKSGRSLSYGEITRGQQIAASIPDDPELTLAAQWHIAGAAIPKVDGRAFVTGEHKYTSDMTRPGMLRGKVLRPSAFNATLAALDTRAASQLPGIKIVQDGNFVGVTAPDEKSADEALQRLRAEWKVPLQTSDKELFDYLRNNVDNSEEGSLHEAGSVLSAMASAEKRVSATYTVQYIAHAPLEPRAALAEWNDGNLTVWTGTQRPFAVRDELAEAFRIPRARVRVIVPDTGSAYGGKHTGEAAIEAARLAKAAGQPVKLVWTREEEFTWAYFRPAGVIDVKSGATADGKLVAWEYDNYNSGPAAMGTAYEVPNQRIQFHPVRSPLRQGSYRSLAAAANHFARESHMDEMAHSLGIDPLEFRLKNIVDPRLRAVFEAAAQRFGWRKQTSSAGRGFGLAGGFEKGGYVATCAEVEIQSGGAVRIRRVVEAFECGAVVNPEGLRNQIGGAIVQGIGGALFEAVNFENGRILNPRFSQYRVPRFADTPQIEIHLVNRKDLPSAGAGETPLVGIAPAVANAIFHATGTRLRSLPMLSGGLLPTPAQS
jgi:isoquinoline 1-oxidoreductase